MTELTSLQKKVLQYLEGIECRFYEPMAKHTSFRIGGPAEVMAFPSSPEQVRDVLIKSSLLDCKIYIIGAGTNILAPDEGLSGIVICLKDALDGMEMLDSCRIRIAAGVTMARAAVFAAGLGLSGMEFAHGIPGTIGGGVYMNAGAYGGEIKDICESVTIVTRDGLIRDLSAQQMGFSYRHSRLEDSGDVVLSAVFRLNEAPPEQIKHRMQELVAKRRSSQPLDMPSAGSAFKRPVGGYAAALIDQTGLKGFRIGDAGVSEKHAGFVVNLGSASAQQVKTLLAQVSDRVFEATGIRLEPEVRIW